MRVSSGILWPIVPMFQGQRKWVRGPCLSLWTIENLCVPLSWSCPTTSCHIYSLILGTWSEQDMEGTSIELFGHQPFYLSACCLLMILLPVLACLQELWLSCLHGNAMTHYCTVHWVAHFISQGEALPVEHDTFDRFITRRGALFSAAPQKPSPLVIAGVMFMHEERLFDWAIVALHSERKPSSHLSSGANRGYSYALENQSSVHGLLLPK